jgi:hypothetical protein
METVSQRATSNVLQRPLLARPRQLDVSVPLHARSVDAVMGEARRGIDDAESAAFVGTDDSDSADYGAAWEEFGASLAWSGLAS